MDSFGKTIFIIGLVVALVGAVLWLGGKWIPFGKLPGDIAIRKGNFGFYFPIVTCVVISVLLTLILNFFRK